MGYRCDGAAESAAFLSCGVQPSILGKDIPALLQAFNRKTPGTSNSFLKGS